MSERIKKPGYMGRAVIAWILLNFITFGTLYAIVYVLGEYLPDLLKLWYVLFPLVVVAAITEYAIAIGTIVPVISEWIKQEECVPEGGRPSWVKGEAAKAA